MAELNNNERLLSRDPLGAFEKIKQDYLRYFRTMYRFKNEELDRRKNQKIEEDGNLYKEPYCELTPRYEKHNESWEDICKHWSYDKNPLPIDFDKFLAGGMMAFSPFRHQFEMLCKGYGQDRNVLITSGTGSGKTESFLLPLFASLLGEAQKWRPQKYDPNWYRNREERNKKVFYRSSQREGEERPAAIRALLLYPMNALVADQVGRLRKALDSDKVRNYFDTQCEGNRIFFGSYNGKTVKSANTNTVEWLDNLPVQTQKLLEASQQGGDTDDIYVAPRINDTFTGEMLVREDMQQFPPDIMITNVSMLSIMLMRWEEQEMLDKTKDYYENNPEAKFHIVVDELHLHRGTAGAEVAYMLRMFLQRIGVPPMKDGKPNPQLRIYTSSASISDEDAEKYLEDFFGVYGSKPLFIMQCGYPLPLISDSERKRLDYSAFDTFAFNNKVNKLYYLQDEEEKLQTQKEFLTKCGFHGTYEQFIERYCPTITKDLVELAGGTTFPLSDFSKLSGCPSDEAIRGFLIFRGTIKGDYLPSIRFHQFYKYIEGIWGELLPDKDTQHDGLIKSPIGEVMYSPEEVSSTGEHKMLELLRCECCGELFIGGNRKYLETGKIGMSLNDPKLDQIPNMQATPMVQRKKVEDYVLFWPTPLRTKNSNGFYKKNPQDQGYERFGVVNIVGGRGNATRNELGNNDCHGAWKEGFLNPYDGSISDTVKQDQKKKYIHGFYYYPTGSDGNLQKKFNDKPLKALPCKCPACEQDYRTRLYTQSPIRSFRTGMGRNNQLFSKELLYQLDPRTEHQQPKLIGFSDSRQDAAEQAKLIAKEHYRDVVRLLFIRILESKLTNHDSEALRKLKKNICKQLPDSDYTLKEIISDTIGHSNASDTEKNALQSIICSDVTTEEKLVKVQSYAPEIGVIDLNKMISTSSQHFRIDGELVKELLKLGINPAGTDYADMYPISERAWESFYDFINLEMSSEGYTMSIMDKPFPTYIYNKLQSIILDICFLQYMKVNTEVSGLGYVMPADMSNVQSVQTLQRLLGAYLTQMNTSVENVLSAMVRVYGNQYRYDGDFEPVNFINYDESTPKKIKKVIKRLSSQANVSEDELGRAIIHAMQAVATDENGKLILNKPLRFKLAHAEDDFYVCKKCGRVHLHKGLGFCTNIACMEELPDEPSGKVRELWSNNYISYDVKIDPHTPKRLHAEELTGQTDDQTKRLLQFKDIILDGTANNEANIVDMLSVTTTMEVGVDIGSLQAIYQGNMPPTRYNYQQRVGRAGRRGQAFSAALTFCRGRSHDNYYYNNGLKEITGGTPSNPTLSVDPRVGNDINSVILKRVLLKHILMLISANKKEWACDSGTCGQLGYKGSEEGDWKVKVRPVIKEWISSHQCEIIQIIHQYTDQYSLGDSCIQELLTWINDEVLLAMDHAINSSIQNDNAQAITEAGLLPMYGMPSAVRELYHHASLVNRLECYDGGIDRPLEQSISEFAPGAMKTKDHAEYMSAGLTVPLSALNIFKKITDLKSSKNLLDPLEFSYNIELNGSNISRISHYDSSEIDQSRFFRLVIPKAFRTEKLINNKGMNKNEDDSRSNFMPLTVWVDAKISSPTKLEGGTVMWEVWNGSKDPADIWYVNLNNDKFFEGQKAWKYQLNRDGTYKTKEPNFLSPNVAYDQVEEITDTAPNFMVFNNQNPRFWTLARNKEKIVLGAKKVTDILCLTLSAKDIPDCLELNALKNEGRNRAAIIAAFYSAATLIQRTFADKIDIQPEEIEISEVKIDAETGMPSVFLNDKAPNGAGFISLLMSIDPKTHNLRLVDIMKDIVSEHPTSSFIKGIRKEEHLKCVTSCPKCLNTFYNRGLHHVLDWRLGMDIIQLMLDKTYRMGYDNLSETPYGDLSSVLNKLGERVCNSHPLGLQYYPNKGIDWRSGYFITENQGQEFKEHLVHPFWKVEQEEFEDGFEPQDMFTLQRNVKSSPVKTKIQHLENQRATPRIAEDDIHNVSSKDYGSIG